MSSINTICSQGNISKGILYHYFKNKDKLYLACVQACFDKLTSALREGTAENPCLEQYFDIRLTFFAKNPLLLSVFCGAIISPPTHLKAAIDEIKTDFDALNISILTALLKTVSLRADITENEVTEIFRLYQDFINARYQMEGFAHEEWARHEQICRRSLDILLYGVVKREETK